MRGRPLPWASRRWVWRSAFGPRVVSVADNGSYYTAGWGLFNNRGILMSQWANPTGQLNLGSHVIDSTAGIIYAQVPESTSQAPSSGNPLVPAPTTPAAPTTVPPVLTAYDADNLTVRERLRLAENLAGKSILNAAHDVMYAISDSGVTVLPVGSLRQSKRVTATAESLV